MKFKKWIILTAVAALFVVTAAVASASAPIRLFVDGKEIRTDVSPTIENGRTMVPIRWVAEALGADVNWEAGGNKVAITSGISGITKDQVADWIRKQGKFGADSYYFEGLSFKTMNLDADADLEVVAWINGAVHLGDFFVFDRGSDGSYRLVSEHDWKVERTNFDHPIELAGKTMYETVSRTGGTGVDIFTAHLWYLEKGKLVEAWNGALQDREVSYPGNYYLTMGSYQVDQESGHLYEWQTAYQLDEDFHTKGTGTTTVKDYKFDGKQFVAEQ